MRVFARRVAVVVKQKEMRNCEGSLERTWLLNVLSKEEAEIGK